MHPSKDVGIYIYIYIYITDGLTPEQSLFASNSNLIETITELRDKQFHAAVCGGDGDNKGGGTRYTSKRLHAKVLALPNRMVVSVPAMCGFEITDITVLTSKPGSPLWVEFSYDVVHYLCSVVTMQVQNGMCSPRKHPRSEVADDERVEVDEAGVSFCYTRQQFRVTHKDLGGKRRCQTFSVKSNGLEEAREKAVRAARACM